VFLLLDVGHADATLVEWNTFGNLGTETIEPSVSNDTNLAATNLTLGAGVDPAANGNRFGGDSWFDTGDSPTPTLAQAIAGNDYIEFIVSPNSGFSFTPTSLVFSWESSNTGPDSVTLRSSFDSFSTDLGSVLGMTGLSSHTLTIAGLSNVSTATTFRLYGHDVEVGPATAVGTAGFDTTTNAVNVVLNGTTAAIPEPGAIVFGGLVCGVIGLVAVGRRCIHLRAFDRGVCAF
jgi:hypothetical protein